MRKRMMSTLPSYINDMDVVYDVQLMMMAWNGCTQAAELQSIKKALQSYLL